MKLQLPNLLFVASAAALTSSAAAQVSFDFGIGPPTSNFCGGATGACELPDGSLLCCSGGVSCGSNHVCKYDAAEGKAFCDCRGNCSPGQNNTNSCTCS
ncbi:hypothetical protein AYL99_06394 [Fonsecaea erecta]|uniref:EGF-like domain-containing protein n=1 Tax=Fonsecaea erecta TaxID=1367422 RepID=A0A178ZI22_9EURO|nr:hypothetical protein AYL99_06394 [Fonsecaea erecta]OAP59096.1 hypothetical protein AYL99_06394 [Fonsecaea erecta]